MRLDPFYLIVDSSEWIERLVPLGVKLVQLRVKDRPDEILRQEIRRTKAVCAAANCQLVVNDYWKLAIDEGCDFIHLGQEDLVEADLDAIRRAGLNSVFPHMTRRSSKRLWLRNLTMWRSARSIPPFSSR